MIVADPEWFILKVHLVIYIKAFVELYNQKIREQVHKILEMIKFEKMHTSTVDNFCNLGGDQVIKISSILQTAYVVSRDQEKVVLHINNYIYWYQFNQLYDLDWIKKSIKNINVIASKLRRIQ